MRILSGILLAGLLLSACQLTTGEARFDGAEGSGEKVYLFSSFRGNGEDGLHLAYSSDGMQWTALNNDASFLKPEVGGKLMRDPCIVQGPDGIFHMVWTTGWTDRGIGLAHSKDLIEWSDQKFIPVMEHEPTARNAWAPEIFWDGDNKQYAIYWASTIPEKFTGTAAAADKGWNHRIYYTTTRDFENYTATGLFFEPGFNVIDSTIISKGDGYIMVFKDETRYPPAKNLLVTHSHHITGPWGPVSKPFTPASVWVEGPTILKIDQWYIVYYDEYIDHRYGAMRTKDFRVWELISDRLDFPKGSRHGTAFPVAKSILENLLDNKNQRQR